MTNLNGNCDLCESNNQLDTMPVAPFPYGDFDHTVSLCTTCQGEIEKSASFDINHLYCLQGAAWSEKPAIQVLSSASEKKVW